MSSDKIFLKSSISQLAGILIFGNSIETISKQKEGKKGGTCTTETVAPAKNLVNIRP